MNDSEIESGISREIKRTTPDILDSLMNELGLDANLDSASAVEPNAAQVFANVDEPAATQVFAIVDESDATQTSTSMEESSLVANPASASTRLTNEPKRTKKWRIAVLPIAAAVILVAIGIVAWPNFNRDVYAVVGLDVNPSIEISVDSNERVLSAKAVNDDASVVLEGLDLEDADLNTACYAVIGSMLVKGYLKADSNSILVSISSSDGDSGKTLERKVAENLDSYLQDSDVDVSILGQYIQESDELERFASENGISLGKAGLIKKLLDLGTLQADEASLLKLSTQELILLARERNVEAETSIGTSDTSEYITKDKAISIALKDAGIQGADAHNVEVEFDCEDSILVYEVEFPGQGGFWEYVINARTGEILSGLAVPVYDADDDGWDDEDDDVDDADDDDNDWDDGDDSDGNGDLDDDRDDDSDSDGVDDDDRDDDDDD